MRPSYNDSLFYSRVCAHDVPLTCKETPVTSTHQTDQTAHCYCSCKTSWCLCFLFRYLQNLSSTRKPFNVSLFYECKMCLTCRVSGEGVGISPKLLSLLVVCFCIYLFIHFNIFHYKETTSSFCWSASLPLWGSVWGLFSKLGLSIPLKMQFT